MTVEVHAEPAMDEQLGEAERDRRRVVKSGDELADGGVELIAGDATVHEPPRRGLLAGDLLAE